MWAYQIFSKSICFASHVEEVHYRATHSSCCCVDSDSKHRHFHGSAVTLKRRHLAIPGAPSLTSKKASHVAATSRRLRAGFFFYRAPITSPSPGPLITAGQGRSRSPGSSEPTAPSRRVAAGACYCADGCRCKFSSSRWQTSGAVMSQWE